MCSTIGWLVSIWSHWFSWCRWLFSMWCLWYLWHHRLNWSSQHGSSNDETTMQKPKKNNIAVATLVTTALYVPGAEVLVRSLDHHGVGGDRVLLYVSPETDPRSDLTPEHIEDLKNAGWSEIIELTKDSDHPYTECRMMEDAVKEMEKNSPWGEVRRFWGVCGKFAIWTLHGYDAVVYMDADSVVLNNFDDVVNEHLRRNPVAGNDDPYDLYALGTPECWEDPRTDCEEFYTAFLLVRPSREIHDALRRIAGRDLPPGADALAMHHRFFSRWGKLPRYTMVAQTEPARPLLLLPDDNDDAAEPMMTIAEATRKPPKHRVDWSRVKVYDFSGPPGIKPWVTYHFQKWARSGYVHGFAQDGADPGSAFVDTYLVPQHAWNDHYDAVLAAKEKRKEAKKKKQTREEDSSSGNGGEL